ncbi:MAG TPA: hypothetical protein VN734_00020 [Acidobacteriaceae bacterium]|jgi:hypothetical protein|nr:hypothetical protein [Acidobacteriaceae bacterium]
MKISSIIILALSFAFLVWRITTFLLERHRQKKYDREGIVVYATFLSSEPIKFFGRPQTDVEKITLRVQEPGSTETREVVIKTRTQPGQNMSPGMRVPVVLDPRNPKRVYPASETAAKRAVATGSRLERRVMQQQMRKPGRGVPTPPSGYQPPQSTLRPRR